MYYSGSFKMKFSLLLLDLLSSLNDELPDDLLWDSGNSNGGLSNGSSSVDPMGGGGQHQQPPNNTGPMMGGPGTMLRNPVTGGMGGPMGGVGGMSNQQTMQNINLVNALNKPKANGPGGGMVVVGGDMRTGGNVGGVENNNLNAMNSNSSLQVGGVGNTAPPQVSSMMGGPVGLVSMAPVNAMSSDLGSGGGGTVVSSMGGGQMGPGGQMRPMGLQQQGMQQQVMMNGPMVRHMSPMGNNGLQQQQIRQPNLIGAVGQPRMINAPGVRMQSMVS